MATARSREAIRAAVQDAAVDQCPAGGAVDTIVLASTEAGSYVFSQGDETVISAGVVDLTIRGDAAEPASAHTIDLADANRFLRIFPGHRVTLERLWLLSGRAPAASDYGGVLIVNESELTLRDVAVYTSSAHSGGAVYFNNVSPAGRLRLERVAFEFNLARDGSAPGEPEAGALWAGLTAGAVELVDVTFRGNEATSASPGAGVAGAMRLLVGGRASEPAKGALRRQPGAHSWRAAGEAAALRRRRRLDAARGRDVPQQLDRRADRRQRDRVVRGGARQLRARGAARAGHRQQRRLVLAR